MATTDSAKAIIEGTLGRYGLKSLATWAWNLYKQGTPIEAIMVEIRRTPDYKRRFPAMEELAAKGRAISEEAYVEYESRATQMMRAYGLPSGFYDRPEDFAKLIAGEVGLPEFEDRLSLRQQAVVSAPAEVRAELAEKYGITGTALTAYWIDPDQALPMLKKQFAAAQIAGAAEISGWGDITKTRAERLAELGVTADQAAEGFGAAQQMRELAMTLPGESEAGVGANALLGAVLEEDAEAVAKVQRKAGQRKAAFEDKGGYAASQKGVTGIGEAR